MNIALLFETEDGFIIENRQVICFNGLTTLGINTTRNSTHAYYDMGGECAPFSHNEAKLVGMIWWRYVTGDLREIPGAYTHINKRVRPTLKERKIREVLQMVRQGPECSFKDSLGSPINYEAVSADWPISVAVAYLQGYRNTSQYLARQGTANSLFERVINSSWYKPKTWIPIWDLLCHDGSDTSILSFAGDGAIRKVAKGGYLANRLLFQDGHERMTKTGRYLKGAQSATVSRNCGGPSSHTYFESGSKLKVFIAKVRSMQDSLLFLTPQTIVEGLQECTPRYSLAQLANEILKP